MCHSCAIVQLFQNFFDYHVIECAIVWFDLCCTDAQYVFRLFLFLFVVSIVCFCVFVYAQRHYTQKENERNTQL